MNETQLSQDEIDALLDGVAPESDAVPAWNGRGASGRGLANGVGAVTGSFDVASAGRFNNGHLPTLALVNERFVELFDKALHQFTGRASTVTAEMPTVTKYGAFTKDLATPSSLNIVRMGPSLGNALFVFDSGLLYFVIDSLFGGSGSMSATKGGRHFTTTEQRLIGRLCDMVFTHYTKAWEPVHPMQFELLRSESETRFVNLAGPDDAVLSYGFVIESGASRGRFQICMPLDGIDPIRDVIMREVREKTATADARWSERLAAQVSAAEIELIAHLASVPVTCKELLGMKIGDVIVLDIKPSIVVCADGVPVLRCRYGNADGRYAIRVEEVVVPSSNTCPCTPAPAPALATVTVTVIRRSIGNSMPNNADSPDAAPGGWTAAMNQPAGSAATERLLEKFTDSPTSNGNGSARNDLELVLDIPVQLSVELGRTRVPIKQILQLAQGSVIELDGLAGEPLDVMVNGCLIAQGEVVVVGERFGIRLTDIITPSERIRKLNR